MNVIELTQEEKKIILENFISCFKQENSKDGKKFEHFLGKFLPRFDFDEVSVTQYSRDGGIDLTAIRKGFDIKGTDNQNYYIQAKCYALNHTVPSKEIDALRGSTKKDKKGNILTNYINVFITTSTFSKSAMQTAEENIHSPVILIDGYSLIDMCIQKGIGFDFKPAFDPEDIKSIISEFDSVKIALNAKNDVTDSKVYDVEKIITMNDVRARILPIPAIIKNVFDEEELETMNLVINGQRYILNINKTRRYLAGVTEIYKNLGMIKSDGMLESKVGKWTVKDGNIILVIE